MLNFENVTVLSVAAVLLYFIIIFFLNATQFLLEINLPVARIHKLTCCSLICAAKKKHFQMMRRMHYNEAMNIKLARQLIASEQEEDEDADEEMRDDTEDMEEISVDPPQDGKEFQHEWHCWFPAHVALLPFCVTSDKNAAGVQDVHDH